VLFYLIFLSLYSAFYTFTVAYVFNF